MWKARVHGRARYAPAAAFAALLAASPVVVASGPASAQSLFEALFGRASQPAPAPLYAPPASPYPEFGRGQRATPKRIVREPRRERAPRHVEVSTKPRPYVAPEVLPGPLGRFLRDSSLRQGDIVATADGLMVFKGSSGSRHSARDFVPIAKAGSLVAGKSRAELAKLDGAARSGSRDAQISIVAETSPPIVAQDEGRRIR